MAENVRDEISDEDLLASICNADQRAFEIFYKRYYQRLFRFSYRVTRRLDLIEEVINDVMLVVWNKSASFNNEAKVSTWILGIAYKKCLKAMSDRGQTELVSLDEFEELVPGVRDSAMQRVELDDWLEAALSRISPEQRAVLELTYHHGMHYSEIADMLGCPENTVKTRVFHARKKLQSLVEELNDSSPFEHNGESL
ncbi:RNA polymerase sigma factor [Methyloterricola oryzae]|uniref:RNA polymerase sigma factor n=1 Tax=Methyloterricola oryzae TaxID=1495050 RepID=UPI0005EBBCBF|nr:sigma-70 family RNA polymerase sigma factor [Methyloterricola oryzae]